MLRRENPPPETSGTLLNERGRALFSSGGASINITIIIWTANLHYQREQDVQILTNSHKLHFTGVVWSALSGLVFT